VSEDDLDELLDRLEALVGARRATIPIHFERGFEEGPFESCDFCGRLLRLRDSLYMIIKYHSEKELKQELTICYSCMGELKRTYSERSLEATQAFFADERLESHRARIRANPPPGTDELTDRCWRCAKARETLSEFIDYAWCEGTELLVSTYPFMQCGRCTLDLVKSWSEQTVEARRRFVADHYGLPPDVFAFEPAELALARRP
jgi:hypothetical protein